jgi:hypothetical protein
LELSNTTLTALSPMRPARIGDTGGQKIARDMDDLRLDAGGLGCDAIHWCLGHHFVTGNVKCMAEGSTSAISGSCPLCVAVPCVAERPWRLSRYPSTYEAFDKLRS